MTSLSLVRLNGIQFIYTGWDNKMLPLFDCTQVFEMRTYSISLFTDLSQKHQINIWYKRFFTLSLVFSHSSIIDDMFNPRFNVCSIFSVIPPDAASRSQCRWLSLQTLAYQYVLYLHWSQVLFPWTSAEEAWLWVYLEVFFPESQS